MTNGQNLVIVLLVITAVVLTGILVGSYYSTSQSAYAETPVKGGDYIQFRGAITTNTDLLYVINTAIRRMNAYQMNPNGNKGLELISSIDLEQAFRAK